MDDNKTAKQAKYAKSPGLRQAALSCRTIGWRMSVQPV
jgi:hypothetical protein